MSQQEEKAMVVSADQSSFLGQLKMSKRNMLIVALIFGIVGGLILWRSFALTPIVASVQAEQMLLPTGASVISDSAANNGKAVKMVQNGNASSNVSLSGNSNSVSIRAHGNKCKGGWAGFSVIIDGKKVLSATASSGSWRDYSAPVSLTQATHSLIVSATNAGSYNACGRSLYVDSVTFYGSNSTPAPTISFSASPISVASGGSSTLTWNSTNASSCTASGAWSGTQPTSGSKSTGALNATSTYNLSCSGTSGTTTASATVSVSSPVTAPGSIYWGSWIDGDTYASGSDAPWGLSTWDTFEAHAGKKVSILHYGQPPMWEQRFEAGVASTITNRGAIPLMDMSSKDVPLTDITSGKYDASIVTWASAAKTWGKPFFFRWNWEMNGTWFNWGSQARQNPAAYVAAWKHMHDVVVAQGATNVTWVWCPNTVFTGSTPLNQLYPGDAYVDWTCADGYNKGPLDRDSWKSFSQVFQPTYNEILQIAPTKPIMIGETASNESGGSKATWIADALQTQLPTNFPKVKAFVWFNWPIYEDNVTQQWPIESSSTAQAAFVKGISSPYYAGNSFGGLSPLTKVQPPR